MTVQILNTMLMLVEACMNTEHGLKILNPKKELSERKYRIISVKSDLSLLGVFIFIISIFFLSPGTFNLGNLFQLFLFLIVIPFQIRTKDLKGFAHEIPFIAFNLLLLYMQYPLQEVKDR